ncbi:MAG: hypothetical protein HY851_09320 [candidate division Zixibacteria bacterium]|nr:hypothetical protein [candidate division Zixibacteria bacterium]
MRQTIGLIVALLFLGKFAYAQPPGNTEIRLKVSGIIGATASGDTLIMLQDGPVKFPIEYVNRDIYSYNPVNGFKVFSPDGATWAHLTPNGGNVKMTGPHNPQLMPGIWVDSTGVYPKSDFLSVYKFNLWGADGAGKDTVMFGAAAGDATQRAIRPLDSGIFFYIIIRPKVTDIGKHICIDSTTTVPVGHPWTWTSSNVPTPPGAYTTYPTWKGPWCFVIGNCCQGLAGNFDCDPNDMCDIADVTEWIDRHFLNPRSRCCPGEENVDGSSDGQADISDLTALIDHLFINFTPPAPCR